MARKMLVPRMLAVLAVLLLFGAALRAQDETVLVLGQKIEREIKGGEKLRFAVDAEAGQFLRFRVSQKGVDVLTLAFDSNKTKIAEVDSQSGRLGDELLDAVVDSKDRIAIEVGAGGGEPAGRFTIVLEVARAATEKDRAKIGADKIFWEADALRLKRTAESRREAIVRFDRAFSIYRELDDAAGKAYAAFSLGLTREALGDFNKALENYQMALRFWEESGQPVLAARATLLIGKTYISLGDTQAAIEWAIKAREAMKAVGNRTGEASAVNNLAVVYSEQGKNEQAIENFKQVVAIDLELGRKFDAAIVYSNIGIGYLNLGDFESAFRNQERSVALFRELDNKDEIAAGLLDLGGVDFSRGEPRKALPFYQEALALCLGSGNKNCEARAYNNLSSAYRFLGDIQATLEYSAKSIEIFRGNGSRNGLGLGLNERGLILAAVGDDQRALAAFSEALEIFRKSQNRNLESNVLQNIGDIYLRNGNPAGAEEQYRQSLSIRREIRAADGIAVSLKSLGNLQIARGKPEDSIPYFAEALEIDSKTGNKIGTGRDLLYLGIAARAQGKNDQAADYLRRALAGFRELGLRSDEAFALYQKSLLEKQIGKTDDAIASVEAAIAIVEALRKNIAANDLQTSYFASVQKYYELYVELLMQKNRETGDRGFAYKALQASEMARARGLLDLLAEAETDLRSGVDPKLLAREKELIEEINARAANQLKAVNDPQKKEYFKVLTAEIEKLTNEYETLQAAIRKADPRYASITRRTGLTLAEAQKLLDRGTALIEIRLGEERSYLWRLTPDGIESRELPGRNAIEAAARELYESLIERNRKVEAEPAAQRSGRISRADEAVAARSAALAGILFGKPDEPPANKTVAVVADGILQLIPFDLLLPASEIVSLPSLNVLAEIRGRNPQTAAEKTLSVFADPVFDPADTRFPEGVAKNKPETVPSGLKTSLRDFGLGEYFPRLLATRIEAQSISALVPKNLAETQLDFSASRENVTDRDLTKYRIIHFATHGLLNTARPELSGLVFSLYDRDGQSRDGFLRLNQIYKLKLNADLVVLSACQTALGRDVRGEGLIGLTRGFMYAGARRIVASLWKVDDAATAEFMKIFYRNMLVRKLNPAAALSRAKQEIRQIARFKSPYYWAGFTIQGDWR
ncbi:MAG: CHAT domain-containing protein [Acidobacteria bacterium]|nr:CHAT domain-containing protein [Acidobacteriota bacterium]